MLWLIPNIWWKKHCMQKYSEFLGSLPVAQSKWILNVHILFAKSWSWGWLSELRWPVTLVFLNNLCSLKYHSQIMQAKCSSTHTYTQTGFLPFSNYWVFLAFRHMAPMGKCAKVKSLAQQYLHRKQSCDSYCSLWLFKFQALLQHQMIIFSIKSNKTLHKRL